MKYLSILLLAIYAICSAPARPRASSRAIRAATARNRKTTFRSLQSNNNEYDPWPDGTAVYWQFPNEGWWKGEVTHFSHSKKTYTVTWEDGSLDYYDDFDQVDQMVAYAQNDPNVSGQTEEGLGSSTYPIGTPVGEMEDGQWYVGTIIDYSNGQYTVRWADSDGETERFAAGPTLNKMVADADKASAAAANGSGAAPAATDPPASETTTPPKEDNSPELWTEGTPVAEYEDDQWYFGHITAYKEGWYTIMWDDGEIEAYNSMDRVNQMVADAEAQQQPAKDIVDEAAKFPVGTPVSTVDSDGKTWTGKVESYYKGFYAIRWDQDNSIDTYKNGPQMDQMVLNANPNYFSSGGMKSVGTAFLVLLVIGLVAAAAFFAYRRRKVKKSLENEQKTAALEEPRDASIVNYRDEPEEPKII